MINPQMSRINEALGPIIQEQLGMGTTQASDPSTPSPAGVDDFAMTNNMPDEMGPERATLKPIDKKNIRPARDKQKLETIARIIYELAEEGFNDRSSKGFDEELDEAADIFECAPPVRKGPWQGSCQIVTPDTPNAIETVTSRIVETLFAQRPWLSVEAVDPTIDAEAAENQQRFIQSMFEHSSMDFVNRMHRAIKTERVDGTHFGYTSWVRRVKKVTRRTPINEAFLDRIGVAIPPDPINFPWVRIGGKNYKYGTVQTVSFEEVVENRFNLDFINAQDVFMHPADSTSIEAANVFGHFFYQTVAQMEDEVRNGNYDEAAVAAISSGAPTERTRNNDGGLTDTQTRGGISRSGRQRQDRYGSRLVAAGCARVCDADGDGMYEDVFFVLDWNTKRLLRLQLNPFHNGRRPYRELALDRRIRWEFYGYSGVLKLKDLQYELNALTRQMIDAGTLNLSAIVEQESGSRRKVSDNRLKIGVNYHDADLDGSIKEIHQFNLISNSNIGNRNDVRAMLQRVAAADDVLQGGQSESNRPLGETNLVALSANVRHKPLVREALAFLTWVYEQARDYCLQFMEENGSDYFIKDDTGKEIPYRITIADLAAPTTISAYCASLDPDVSLQKQIAEKVFVALAQSPFAQADPVRMYNITERYVSIMDPQAGKEIQRFLGPKQQAQMVSQAMTGGMSPTPVPRPGSVPPEPNPGGGPDRTRAVGGITVQ